MEDFEYEEEPVDSGDLVGKVANIYPETQDFLSSLGMHYFSCVATDAETFAEVYHIHGLNTFKVKWELNRIITENPARRPRIIRLKQREIKL